MKYPTFQERERSEAWRRERISLREEKRLWKKGYKYVVGLDEAGRGALSGPVVAAAVLVNSKFTLLNAAKRQSRLACEAGLFNRIKDSKKLTPKKREEFYKILINYPQIEWGIGRVSEKVIDKINILEATKLAMKRAIKNLEKKYRRVSFLILDGNFEIDSPIPQKSIVKADEKVFSCSVASIIAKVTRDRIMRRYHKKYLQYGFDKHKGYPTKQHRKMLKKYGPCKIHRKTFKPVKSCKNKNYLLS